MEVVDEIIRGELTGPLTERLLKQMQKQIMNLQKEVRLLKQVQNAAMAATSKTPRKK